MSDATPRSDATPLSDATPPAGDPPVIARDDLVILVNSTEGYADAWEPCFALLEAYWPGCRYDIVLNTERTPYTHPRLRIRSSRTWPDPGAARPGWGESMRRCLVGIEAPVVLYLQEDYFLNAPVDVARVEQFTRIMLDEDRPHVRLRELGASRYEPLPEHPELWRIPNRSPYLVSLQAGLWLRSALLELLRPEESPWEFERRGTLRARRSGMEFLCPDLERWEWSGNPIVPYEPTGIVRGRWFAPAVVDLFAAHGLEVDFSRRGFYEVDRRERVVRAARAWARRVAMRALP